MYPLDNLYIEVRVLKELGDIITTEGIITLTNGSYHYLKRSDVRN